ncbi:MAG: hypothetical protein U0805_20890 [Pirellulales bacterium]
MPVLNLDGDARGAVQATNQFTEAVKKTGKAFDETAAAAKKLENEAGKIVRENETSQERYNRKVEQLGKLFVAGKLSLEQMDRALARYRSELEQVEPVQEKVFGSSALEQAKSYLGGIASVTTALSAFRSEWNAIAERQRAVTQTQLDSAGARDLLKQNIFGLPDDQRKAIISQADAIGESTKLPQKTIDVAIANTVSSRGGDAKEAARFVEFATRFTRDPNAIGEMAGSLGDIANAIATNDPQQALGFLTTTMQRGRPTDLRQVATNLPKLTQAVRGYGGDPRYGAGLFAGLTVGSADTQGDISRTAGIRLSGAVGEFFEGTKTTGFDNQLNTLLKDPQLAQKFLDKNSFEAGATPAIRALLLDRDSAARKAFESTVVALGNPDDQRAAGARGIEFMAGGKLASTRRADELVASRMERYQLNSDAMFAPERREEIKELVRATTGQPAFFNTPQFAARTGPTLSLEEAVSELTWALKNKAEPHNLGYDAEAQRQATQLLQELIELQKEQLRATQSLDNKTSSVPIRMGRQE